MWYDLYDYATRVEYQGVGIYANKTAAPRIAGPELEVALTKVLGETHEAEDMISKAKLLSKTARMGGGRFRARDAVLRFAEETLGKV